MFHFLNNYIMGVDDKQTYLIHETSTSDEQMNKLPIKTELQEKTSFKLCFYDLFYDAMYTNISRYRVSQI